MNTAKLFTIGAAGGLILILGSNLFYSNDLALTARLTALEAENQVLKKQFSELIAQPVEAEWGQYSALEARIFSKYPNNLRSMITISAGSKNGLRVGMPVVTDTYALIGIVTKVLGRLSLVQTIYDSDWSMPVLLTGATVPGLYIGGPVPEIQMVARDVAVKGGELIITADERLPYGLIVGQIAGQEEESSEPLRKLKIGFTYDLSRLQKVLVITNFETFNE